jgi:hypothetical protein
MNYNTMQKLQTMKSELCATERIAVSALRQVSPNEIFNLAILNAVHHGDPDKARQAFQMIKDQVYSGNRPQVTEMIGANLLELVMSL